MDTFDPINDQDYKTVSGKGSFKVLKSLIINKNGPYFEYSNETLSHLKFQFNRVDLTQIQKLVLSNNSFTVDACQWLN